MAVWCCSSRPVSSFACVTGLRCCKGCAAQSSLCLWPMPLAALLLLVVTMIMLHRHSDCCIYNLLLHGPAAAGRLPASAAAPAWQCVLGVCTSVRPSSSMTCRSRSTYSTTR
jgi:hypothetical protein